MARAKFTCVSKMGIETFTVVLEPCVKVKEHHEKTSKELLSDGRVLHPDSDLSFFAGFPHANIVLSAITKEAGAEFEIGKETWVDFKLATEAD